MVKTLDLVVEVDGVVNDTLFLWFGEMRGNSLKS